MKKIKINEAIISAIKMSLKQQLPIFVFCALLLDGGRIVRVCLIASLGFWLFALLIVVRKPQDVGPGGIGFLRCGFPSLFALLLIVNHYLHPIIRH